MKRDKPLVVIAVSVLVVNKASDTHPFYLFLLTICIRVLIVVCMSRIVFKCYLKCVDPSSDIATP